ncbi:MAG: alpha/beta hydrolase [Anaerolineaceae bacterium]|nr:alpha/beta hydrolase [Anaerolineaceae bacterium]
MTAKKRVGWRWLLRIAGGLLALLVLGLIVTTLNASIRDNALAKAPLPAGSQLIDVGGRDVHVYVQGADYDGPAVVFVGCFGCNSAIWQAVQPDVSQFARTIAFDPAGYAWSEPGPTIMPQTMADDLFAVLTALGEEEVVLVGFSAGMLPVYDFYARYGRQITVTGMVSIEGSLLTDIENEWYTPDNPLGLSEGMADFLIATGVARPLAGQMQGPMPDSIKNVAYYSLVSETARTRTSIRTWASQYSTATTDDIQRVLATAPLPVEPVVVVLQSADILATEDAPPGFAEMAQRYAETSVAWYADWVASAAPGSQVIVVPDTSHFIMFDQPQAVVDAVQAFFE